MTSSRIKLIEAAETLKENCKNSDCRECAFNEHQKCVLNNYPDYWALFKQSRWADEDIALAKALKAFGVVEIYRYYNFKYWYKEDACGDLPKNCFKNLNDNEKISLDDIINNRS